MQKVVWLLSLSLILFAGCTATTQTHFIPKDVRARLDLAQSYIMQEQPRLAIIELKKIGSQGEDLPYFHFLKGLAYLETKEFKKAITSLSKATHLNPSYGDAWNNLGLAYLADKNEDKAMECFKRALGIETYITPEYAAHNIALIYKKRKELDKAIEYEKKAILLNWRYLPAYISIASLCTKKGDIPCTIKWLKKGIESYPDNANLYFLLGESYLRLGKKEKAKKTFEKVISLEKTNNSSKIAKMARDYLDLIK